MQFNTHDKKRGSALQSPTLPLIIKFIILSLPFSNYLIEGEDPFGPFVEI